MKCGDHPDLSITVVDDSRLSHIIEANLKASIEIGRRYQMPMYFVGIDERVRFANELIKFGLPEEVVRYGLVPEQIGIRMNGANRNASLLAQAGHLFLSVDDDTVCKTVEASDLTDDLNLQAVNFQSADPIFPCDLQSYPSFDAMMDSIVLSDRDVLGPHQRILGKSISECTANRENYKGSIIPITQRPGYSLGRKRVMVTLNGLAGDCGWRSPSHYLWLRGRSFEALTQTEAHYQNSCSSRIVNRVVDRITLTKGCSNMMATFFALDNREVLPPFPSMGYGLDVVFGRVLSACFPEACFGHLPYALLHLPIEARAFQRRDIVMAAFGIDTCILTIAILASISPYELNRDSSSISRFQTIGLHFERVGNLTARDATAFIRRHVLSLVDGHFAELQEQLRDYGARAPFWEADVKEISHLQKLMSQREGYHLPAEFTKRRNYSAALSLSQTYLRNYGRLLQYWPQIVQASIELRQHGKGLARNLD
jgi:hypothetical protein